MGNEIVALELGARRTWTAVDPGNADAALPRRERGSWSCSPARSWPEKSKSAPPMASKPAPRSAGMRCWGRDRVPRERVDRDRLFARKLTGRPGERVEAHSTETSVGDQEDAFLRAPRAREPDPRTKRAKALPGLAASALRTLPLGAGKQEAGFRPLAAIRRPGCPAPRSWPGTRGMEPLSPLPARMQRIAEARMAGAGSPRSRALS
jgi:hypothetical protein